MAEQLLDAAQIGAAIQEVRSEAVAQGVRRGAAGDAGTLGPDAQPPAHVAGTQRRVRTCSGTEHALRRARQWARPLSRDDLPSARSCGCRLQAGGALQVEPQRR